MHLNVFKSPQVQTFSLVIFLHIQVTIVNITYNLKTFKRLPFQYLIQQLMNEIFRSDAHEIVG